MVRPFDVIARLVALLLGCVLVAACVTTGEASVAPRPTPSIPVVASPLRPLSETATPTASVAVPSVTPPAAPSPSTLAAIPPPPCDIAPPVRVDRLAAGRACFGSGDIMVLGFAAPSWGVGGTGTGVVPYWLGEPMQGPVLWLKPRNPDGCYAADDCVWEFVHVRPGAAMTTWGPPERWVEVIGHFDDQIAKACRWDGSNPPGFTPKQAVDLCRDAFVVTNVRDAPAP